MVGRAQECLLQAALAACPDAHGELKAAVIAACFNAFFHVPRGARGATHAGPTTTTSTSTSTGTSTSTSTSTSSASSSDACSTGSSSDASSSSSGLEGETGPEAHEPGAGSGAGTPPSSAPDSHPSDPSLAHPEGAQGRRRQPRPFSGTLQAPEERPCAG